MRQSPPSPEPAAELGRQVRMHRTASNRKQHEVAEAAGLKAVALNRLELGTAGDVRISTVARVAAELGLELQLMPLGKGAGDDPRAA